MKLIAPSIDVSPLKKLSHSLRVNSLSWHLVMLGDLFLRMQYTRFFRGFW